ncbi:heme-binding protein [Sphingomonas sp. MMS24-J13]|uniref:heme-binding protein n=1 Tax=Sphingomonas sp. MMS24-J13 TaxID=3238686 RepID=UPI00384B8C18
MPQHFQALPSRSLDGASAAVALSAAAKCAVEKGDERCIVVVGADMQVVADAEATGNDAPPIERLIDRARRAAILSIETDGIGSEQGPELAALHHATGAHAPIAVTICSGGRLIGAIGVTSHTDAGNHDVAEAGRSALLQLFARDNA